jgi:predicted N-acetyltransferase YhbS
MGTAVEIEASGHDYLALVTDLLRRMRAGDPLAGMWEAADLQWWWRKPRRSDRLAQTFWTDDRGPAAGVVLTDWGDRWGCDPIVADEGDHQLRRAVWDTAQAKLLALRPGSVEIAVRDDDAFLRVLVLEAGFEPSEHGDTTTWMDAADVPATLPLPDGFRLADRMETATRHHLVPRNGPDVEQRLRQTSMYDPALDLVIWGPTGEAAAYALFWFDPVTLVGLVEPLRTEDEYQRRGLARTLLAAGLDRLVLLGAQRLKVSYVTDAAGALYRGAGFKPASTARTYTRQI